MGQRAATGRRGNPEARAAEKSAADDVANCDVDEVVLLKLLP